MAEPTLIQFSYKELVALMLREKKITTGIWGIFTRFGIAAANVGADAQSLRPAAIVPVVEIGLQPFPEQSALTVDAAKLAAGAPPSEC